MRHDIETSCKAIDNSLDKMQIIQKESKRVAEVSRDARFYLDDYDTQFERYVKLNKFDMTFLFTAVALQCIRQYVIGTITQRTGHDQSDKTAHNIQETIFGETKAASQINAGVRYRATKDEIMRSFSVPYDCTKGTKQYGVGGIDSQGVLKGLSGNDHRFKTLGHDPLFGWIFGTSNIMTNTITNKNALTFHVKKSTVVSQGGIDKTQKMFDHVIKRAEDEPTILGAAVIKQGLHIMSDQYSKKGIALPGTVKLNSELAQCLAELGLDYGNLVKVGAQAGMAAFINMIIGMVHGLYYDESVEFSRDIYSVRTKKILSYSNLIASSSNVIAVAIGAVMGAATQNGDLVERSLNYLDIGGIIVTIHRIVNDKKFIYEIKKEFITNQWFNLIMELPV